MAFTMYDANNSGYLTSKDISAMIKECYGKISAEHNVWQILDNFDSNGDSKVSRNEFIIAYKKHPALLEPAIRFQIQLKQLISSSNRFWSNIYLTSSR